MKYWKCNLLAVCLLLPFAGYADYQEKKVTRNFNITTNGQVMIDNRYGDIDIAIGPAGFISFEVTISSDANNDSRAKENIERVQILFSEGQNQVSAKTEISSPGSWTSWFGNNNNNIRINYKVLVPADVYQNLSNKYGNVFIASSDRDVKLDVDYGDIRLGDINASLLLDLDYGGGSISQIKTGAFDLEYSTLNMEDAGTARIDMKYTTLTSGSISTFSLESEYGNFKGQDMGVVDYDGKYDDIRIDRVKTINAEGEYVGLKIGQLDETGNFQTKYGDLSIGNIQPQLNALAIDCEYTGVRLQFHPSTSYTIEVDANYCGVNRNGLNVKEWNEKNQNIYMLATRGNNPKGKVSAEVNYGELKIE